MLNNTARARSIQMRVLEQYKEQPANFRSCITPEDNNTLPWTPRRLPNGMLVYIYTFVSSGGRRKMLQCVENTIQHTLSLDLHVFNNTGEVQREVQRLNLRTRKEFIETCNTMLRRA